MKNWLGQDKSLSDIQREIYNKEAEIARKKKKIIAKAKAKTPYVPKKSVEKLQVEKEALDKALQDRKTLLESQKEKREVGAAAATKELEQHEEFKKQEEAKKEQNYGNAKKFFFNAIRVYSGKPYDLNAIIGKFAEKENEKSNKIDFVTNVKAAISAIGLAVQTPQTTSQLLWWAGYFLKESQNLAKNETRDESFFIKLLSDEAAQESFSQIPNLETLLTTITPTAISAAFRVLGQAEGNTATTLNALKAAGITSDVVSNALKPLISSAVPALLGYVGDISAIYKAATAKGAKAETIITQASENIGNILKDEAVKGILTAQIPAFLADEDNQVHIATALWTVAENSPGMKAQLKKAGINQALLEETVNFAATIAPTLMPLVYTLATEALVKPAALAALVASAGKLGEAEGVANFLDNVAAMQTASPAIKDALKDQLPTILKAIAPTAMSLAFNALGQTAAIDKELEDKKEDLRKFQGKKAQIKALEQKKSQKKEPFSTEDQRKLTKLKNLTPGEQELQGLLDRQQRAQTLNELKQAGISSKVVSEALTPLIASAVPALLRHVGDISKIYRAVTAQGAKAETIIQTTATNILGILGDKQVSAILTEQIPTLLTENQAKIATAVWTVAENSPGLKDYLKYSNKKLLEQTVVVVSEISKDLMPLIHTFATGALAEPVALVDLVASAGKLGEDPAQDNIAKFIENVEKIPAIKNALTKELPTLLEKNSETLGPLLKQYLEKTEVGQKFYINTEKALRIASRKSSNIVELAKHYGNKNWVGVITEGAKILADKEGLSFVLATMFKKPDLSHQKVTEGIRSNIESNNKGDVGRIPNTWVEKIKKGISPGGRSL